jgi:hypothetical protein
MGPLLESGQKRTDPSEFSDIFSTLQSDSVKVLHVPITVHDIVVKKVSVGTNLSLFLPVLRIRIRIHRIHVFLGHLDPDPLVRAMDPDPDPAVDPDPDPSIIMQK